MAAGSNAKEDIGGDRVIQYSSSPHVVKSNSSIYVLSVGDTKNVFWYIMPFTSCPTYEIDANTKTCGDVFVSYYHACRLSVEPTNTSCPRSQR